MSRSNLADEFARVLRQLDAFNARLSGELAAHFETLSLQDLAALLALRAHGPVRMGDVARHLGLAPASATAVVDRLEAGGLARRQRSEADRRVWRVALSAAGERTLADVDRVYRRAASEMLAPLTDAERATFVALSAKVAGALDQSGTP